MMTREEALEHLETCIRQDRAYILSYLDSLMVRPNYDSEKVESMRQLYRDVTKLEGFPNINYPLTDSIEVNHLCVIEKGKTIESMTTERPKHPRPVRQNVEECKAQAREEHDAVQD